MDTKKILTNWVSLNKFLQKASEQQAEALVHKEFEGANRFTFIERIYGRFSRMRSLRERKQLEAMHKKCDVK